MKFMVAWKIPPALYKAAVARFLDTGAPPPAGVKTIGCWHVPGSFSDGMSLKERRREWLSLRRCGAMYWNCK